MLVERYVTIKRYKSKARYIVHLPQGFMPRVLFPTPLSNKKGIRLLKHKVKTNGYNANTPS